MSKFNSKEKNTTKTVSYEGGTSYSKSLESEWSNLLFSCMMNDGFYESSDEIGSRYIDLTKKVLEKYGPEFVCKAAHFSRNVLGMRSISELTAAILNAYSFEGKRNFYAKYFKRPDGVGEVFGAVKHLGQKRSHALVRGAGDYLASLNAYQVGKYPMNKHEFNMHDIINITHAKSEVIDQYQKGELEVPDTWEVKISSASQEEKEFEWKRLVEENKLGYLALIRNLRNILKCNFVTKEWVQTYLVSQITNEEAIKKSLVFPYQIYNAWKQVNDYLPITLEQALSDAFEISTNNMPKLKGSSAIIVDVSASMNAKMSNNSSMSILEASCVYAAAIYYQNKENTDVIKFGQYGKVFLEYSNYYDAFKLIKAMQQNDGCGHSTCIHTAFELMKKKYDRIFIFSDMQIMDGRSLWGPTKSSQALFDEYNSQYGDNESKIYSFDLGNYHTQLVSQNTDITYITALNNTVFKAIEIKEENSESLIDVVKSYTY